jgi:[ribosomal protein S18]-alanine N-acetyltransferase
LSAALDLADRGAPRTVRRPMHEADLDRVIAIEHDIYPFPWTRTNFADSIAHGYDAWIVESAPGTPGAGETLGYAVLMWVLDETHLLNLSIAAAFHRRGLGGRLLEALIAECRGRGATSMLLEVRPSNEPALALYRKAGFYQIGVRRGYYPAAGSSREDAIVMNRRIDRFAAP